MNDEELWKELTEINEATYSANAAFMQISENHTTDENLSLMYATLQSLTKTVNLMVQRLNKENEHNNKR